MIKAIFMIVSTNDEVKALVGEGFLLKKSIDKGNRRYRHLIRDDMNIILLKSGLGASASASAMQHMIDNFAPKIIVNFGVAVSAKNRDLDKIYVISTAKIFDFESPWFPVGKIPEFPLEYKLFGNFQGLNHTSIASGNSFMWQVEKSYYIEQTMRVSLFDMESGFLAQTAWQNKVALLAFKGVAHILGTNSFRDEEHYHQKVVLMNRNILRTIIPHIHLNALNNVEDSQINS